jgi:hypothetical protein
MKTQNNTFGVIFYLRKYKVGAVGRIPIYARITVNGKRTDVSVKRSIEPGNWNANKGMAFVLQCLSSLPIPYFKHL